MLTNVCKECGKEKPLDQFAKDGSYKLGCINICKECKNWAHRSEGSKKTELELRELRNKGLKRCSKCDTIKSINEFGLNKRKKDGHRVYCMECERKRNREYSWTDEAQRVRKAYMLSEGYFKRLKARYHKKMDTRPDFKTALYLRNQLYNGITGYGAVKEADFITMVGLTPTKLNKYLESQFTEGMTWDNHNRYGWHVDHIIPMDAFNMKDPIQQRASCFYVNLRPMWGRPNIQKGAKYNMDDYNAYMTWFRENIYK